MNMNDAFVGSLIFNKNSGGGGASAMSDLTDVAITSPSEGETLIYDSTSEKWVNGTGSAPALDDLTDVDVTTPSNGDTLVYDSANSKWVNGQGGGKQTALTQAQYDALVQAGTVDPTMEYFITDGIPSSVEYYHNYSTDEHIVGTWIDGSIIYETTFVTTIQLPYGSSITSAINLIDISSYNIGRVIEFNASTKCNEDKDTHYRTYFNGFSVFIYLDDDSGYFMGYQSLASAYTKINWNTIITIRYTKSSS